MKMKKTTIIGLSLAAAGLMGAQVALADAVPSGGAKPAKGLAALKKTSIARVLGKAKTGNRLMKAAPEAGNDPVATHTAPAYGFLAGEDGKQWFYTVSYTTDGYYYKQAVVTLFDPSHKQSGQITVDVPDGMVVNQIVPFGNLTSKLFDKDDQSLEMAIQVHEPGNSENNYQDAYHTWVYSTDGTLVEKYDGQGVLIDASQNEWSKYQRLLLMSTEVRDEEVDGEQVAKYYDKLDIIKPAGWSEDKPSVEHTFYVDEELTYYSEGSFFNVCVVGGEPYYAISHYEKPYVSGYDNTGNPIATADNPYVIETYDRYFSLVGDTVKVPISKPSDALYRMAAFNMMGDDDLSQGYFSTGEGLDYVVTYSDYILSSDGDKSRYSFVVFNDKGDSLKTVCSDVYNTYGMLAPVKGQPDQMMFMQEKDGVQQVAMVNLPTCEESAVMPSTINGETISTDLNRYPDGKGGYDYVVKLGYAAADADGNAIARLGWYDGKTLQLKRYTSFNLGPNGEMFTPNLTDQVLNPYLFDTDDQLEYIYIAKIKRTDSDVIDNVLCVADEDGKVLKEYRGDDDKVLRTAFVLTDGLTEPELAIAYQSKESYEYTSDFYQLPYTKFTKGGSGTKDDPYLISTVGDLKLINAEPKASYKLVADIDMAAAPTDWEPLDEFGGTLDGDGKAISNMTVATDNANAGLFSALGAGATVKNLVVTDPTLTLNADNTYAGVIAGAAMTDTLENVHVIGAQINGESSSAVTGGLVGQMTVFSLVSASSFDGDINLPGSQSVGGIVGETRTSSKIEAAAAQGSFTAMSTLGGIVGATGDGSDVSDSHSSATLKAENTVGGIIGSNDGRARASRCRVDGSIEATQASWNGLSAGGIMGKAASNWPSVDYETGETTFTVDTVAVGCVTNADITIPAPAEGEEADKTVHRIVGFTIANEWYEEGEEPYTEQGLRDNFAASTVKVGGQAVTSDDDESVEGASKEAKDLTKTFFTGLKYEYGTEAASPWKGEDGQPTLWYEDVAKAITISQTALTAEKGETVDLTVTVYGTADASSLDFTIADPSIADIVVNEEDGNSQTLSLTAKKAGTTTITFNADGVEAVCTLTVTDASGINTPGTQAQKAVITVADGRITATGASSIAVYAANGQAVAQAKASSLSTAGMSKGVYVVVAKTADGTATTCKVVVR